MKTKLLFLIALLMMMSGTVMGQTKKVSFLGDSYTTYKGYVYPETNELWYTGSNTNTNVHDVKYTWWHIMLEEMGWELERNNSYSGSTVCHTGYNGDDYSKFSYVTRVDDNNLGSPDIIFIFGATNDRYAGSPLGEYQYADWTKEDLYNFRPAMAYMLNKLKNEQHPSAEIYFILSPYLTDEYDAEIYEICEHYGIEVITLATKFNRSMGGHPTIVGMQEIADEVIAFMKSKEEESVPAQSKSLEMESANYYGLYLDYEVAIPEGITAYTAKLNDAQTSLTLSEVAGGYIPAKEAVIVKSAADATYTFTESFTSAADIDNDLLGVAEETAVTALATEGKAVLTLGKKDGVFGFRQSANTTIQANKTYILVDAANAANFFAIFVDENDGSSGISSVVAEEKASNVFFNLAGQRVAQPTKGLYIVNGKKVIVK